MTTVKQRQNIAVKSGLYAWFSPKVSEQITREVLRSYSLGISKKLQFTELLGHVRIF